MEVFYNNQLSEIKNIVLSTAKYQKVMLLYDDNVSNIKIKEVYETIKEICIYNQCHLNSIDDEIYNGYKAIIYLCSANSFLKLKFNRNEFVNIYYPQNEAILPYFLSINNTVEEDKNYLILQSSNVDIKMIISIYFNRFYNFFMGILNCRNNYVDFSFDNKEVTLDGIVHYIQTFEENASFLDVEIIKNCNIDYEDVVVVDLILINAFLVLITSIKSRSYMLVDVYKSAKDDIQLIDKLYKLYNNDSFENLIILNYNYLYNFCLKTKQKIVEHLNLLKINVDDIDNKIIKIKEYAKQSDDILAYLYLYNIFNV